MRISFRGQLVDEPEIRVGFVGCGSHSFRNLYPTFQFAPVNLVATCDLQIEKGQAFAGKFGAAPNYFTGTPGNVTATWEPEFSLGQLYNKALFLLGYYGEVNEFARSILEKRPLAKADLLHAWQTTRIFEAFAEGPAKAIRLCERPK